MAIETKNQYQLIQTTVQDGSVVFYVTKNAKRVTLNFHNLFKAGRAFNHFANS